MDLDAFEDWGIEFRTEAYTDTWLGQIEFLGLDRWDIKACQAKTGQYRQSGVSAQYQSIREMGPHI